MPESNETMVSASKGSMSQHLVSRPFGKTGLKAAPLGLAGNYGIDADGVERAFHELGVNYFFVTLGMTKAIEGIRRLIQAGHRDQLVLALGASMPTGRGVERAWEKCARALGVDTIDVFQLFWVQAHWYVTGKTWPAMRKLKEEGKARSLGVSCHDRPMARALVDELELDQLMIRYNAAHRGAEKEIFATLESNATARPAIVSYTATRWGKLLKPAREFGPMSAPECYRFAIGNPHVDVVLCGAKSFEELRENAEGILDGPLPEERLAEVKRFGDVVRATATGRLGFAGV
jgi:aryl-alcohol dehydrogenase-like predicted oxidoreductase